MKTIIFQYNLQINEYITNVVDLMIMDSSWQIHAYLHNYSNQENLNTNWKWIWNCLKLVDGN
jgi:hypothetical protein